MYERFCGKCEGLKFVEDKKVRKCLVDLGKVTEAHQE
jgi:hypothetical protein